MPFPLPFPVVVSVVVVVVQLLTIFAGGRLLARAAARDDHLIAGFLAVTLFQDMLVGVLVRPAFRALAADARLVVVELILVFFMPYAGYQQRRRLRAFNNRGLIFNASVPII